MKGKAIVPLVLGLVIGLIAVKFGVDALKRAQASSATMQTVQVVRAKQDIGAFLEITPEMIELVETADNLFVPAGDRIESVEEAVGRVVGKEVAQGTPVLFSMLAPKGTPSGMQGRIPAGYRAVSVKIDEVTGVAYQLSPGDWVDVIVVMDVDSGNRRKRETVAEVILQRIQVAAIGRALTKGDGGSSGTKPAKSATLLVPEEEVPKLHLAATRGKITLSMRGGDDTTTDHVAMAHSNELFKGVVDSGRRDAPKPAPSSAPAKRRELSPDQRPYDVTVYRWSTSGRARSTMEQITFENAHSSNVIRVADNPGGGSGRLMRGATSRRGSASSRPPFSEDAGGHTGYVDKAPENEDAE